MKRGEFDFLPGYGEPQTAEVEIHRFSVGFEYPVVFTRGGFDPANPALRDILCRREPERRHRAALLIDAGAAAALPGLLAAARHYAAVHARHLAWAGEPLVIPGGEACKNDPERLRYLQSWLCDLGIDRQSFLVAVGGGALLDLAGFAAATTHRGVRLVRVPTTVLAQNDSGLGVKNGVNAFGLKNFLGSFAPPFGVLVDFDFLAGLAPRDRRAGLAEAVKVAAIRDAGFFAWLETWADALAGFEPEATEAAIRRCAALHLAQICRGGDPFETGSARPLDFGHWAAHKLEALSGHALRHGEAVAIGMALDAGYSAEVGLLPDALAERLRGLLRRLGFALWHPALDLRDAQGERLVMRGIAEFREHLGGELSLTLLAGLGRGVEVDAVDPAAMARAIEDLRRREATR